MSDPRSAPAPDADEDDASAALQVDLFGADEAPAATPATTARRAPAGAVQAAATQPDDLALARTLPASLRLGTSSWTYPGWEGLVWAGRHSESQLSKSGLRAYARHPLLRAVGIDRGFYRPLTASQYERYALQVPEDFRFTVKAPSLVCDALIRSEDGRGKELNPAFLDPALAVQEFVQPAQEGLGAKTGALVFQISPLPPALLQRLPEQLERLRRMLRALPALHERAPQAVVAVEVRDPQWLTPDFVAVLREAGARYCLGLHPKLPPIEQQLPLLRALWPGPLVCRWNLNRLHGPYGYEEAERRYGEFDRMQDPDPSTRAVLARVAHATARAGHPVMVTISNKAEGSAPLSVRALAQALAAQAAA
ncbi:DUF72 domain-containing protein [Pelomonas sp. CA6]|uniref:DUF72 domain-containing protein n=1 Tax=Pelomonas sp. CA6 TaxID=2907999 RepID=UPI001F4C46DC|nr:DUF72 domain-containing protein [Pelomonas sp. CA6]MCH7345761.1 DUF72 domain-containing protein [Pelomonas sp. CA6]